MGRKHRRRSKNLTSGHLKSVIFSFFRKNPKKRYNAGQLRKKAGLDSSKDAISHALSSLEKEKKIRHVKEGRYTLIKLPGNSGQKSSELLAVGAVDKIKSGAAYIVIDKASKDIYVPSRYLGGALHGDTVEVAYVEIPWKKSPEGRVTRIIKRAMTQVLGTFFPGKKYGTVVASNSKETFEVYVGLNDFNGAVKNDRVLVTITDWGHSQNKAIWGKVSKLMTHLDEHNWTMHSILLSNGFESDFPENVTAEAEKIAWNLSNEELHNRKDMRGVLTFTIDPATAQDFDDAISYQKTDEGHTEVGVHIADVTHYVKPGSALDKEAYKRATSVYLVDRCIPMLPENLSNNICSLRPGEDRFCFSVIFIFNEKNEIVRYWVGKTVIHSDHRMAYEEAQGILDDDRHPMHKILSAINVIAYKLRQDRFAKGSVAFETDEVQFDLDDKNVPVSVTRKVRKDAHMLIEDFMLLANKTVAEHMITQSKGQEIPFVYRVHDLPNDDKLSNLALLCKELGLKMDFSTPGKTAESFNRIAERAGKEYAFKLIMGFAIRAMAKAEYSTDNIGHFGLKFDNYTHFTSPIRRYSDVLAHRIIYKNLEERYRPDKSGLEDMCAHVSKQERKAMEAERQSIRYKMAEFMSQKIGMAFDSFVSGIIDSGLFVEVKETKAEGFLPFSSFYEHFTMGAGGVKIIGNRSGTVYKIGDPITVRLIDVDLSRGQMEFELVK